MHSCRLNSTKNCLAIELSAKKFDAFEDETVLFCSLEQLRICIFTVQFGCIKWRTRAAGLTDFSRMYMAREDNRLNTLQ